MIVPVERASVSPPRRASFASREFVARVISAIVLGAVVLAALVAGGWPFAVVWLAAAIVGSGEWLAISGAQPFRPLLATSAVTLTAVVAAFHVGAPAWLVLLLGGIGLAALLAISRPGSARPNVVLGLLGGIVIALVPTALRDDPGIGLVGPAWMFAVVWSTDIVAYFTGRSFGGPKLLPRVSPKKTWSGALGGLVAGALAGIGVVLVARDHGWPVLGTLPLPTVAIASAAASIVSQAGDLFESGLKRRYGVKDSGRSIPGHGGVMDRLDGFFAVALLVGLYLMVQAILARAPLPA